MRNGSRRLAHERELVATGVSQCRGCQEVKPISEFPAHHAVCVLCHRAKQVAYKRKMRAVYMRERRMAMLRKYLDGVIVDDECPICGGKSEHMEHCSLIALRLSIVQLGWEKRA
jgi:hypothetical protein